MKIEMPWSGWFNKQAKKRRKVEPWVLATISLEEEFEVEMILREVFNYIVEKIKLTGYKLQIFKLSPHNYGIPQQRERVFFVCIREDIYNKNEHNIK